MSRDWGYLWIFDISPSRNSKPGRKIRHEFVEPGLLVLLVKAKGLQLERNDSDWGCYF